jgi:hypothetical protein
VVPLLLGLNQVLLLGRSLVLLLGPNQSAAVVWKQLSKPGKGANAG